MDSIKSNSLFERSMREKSTKGQTFAKGQLKAETTAGALAKSLADSIKSNSLFERSMREKSTESKSISLFCNLLKSLQLL